MTLTKWDGTGQMMVERNAGAARAVRDALEAVGGSGSRIKGARLFAVVGDTLPIRNSDFDSRRLDSQILIDV